MGLQTEETKRGRPRKKETSQKILAATYALLIEYPYSEVSYEKIAERANVTRPTIYRRWSSKEQLVVEAIECVIAEINQMPPDMADPKESFRRSLYNLLKALDDKKLGTVVATVIGAIPHNETLKSFVNQTQVSRRKIILEKIIKQSILSGLIASDRDMGPILDMALGAIYFRLLISGEPLDRPYVDALIEEIFR